MSSTFSKHRQAGFTIVEVMIVLAVAGLILLLTLQAIPTLQRNSRNNQRKQDVSAILEAVSHYELNHSGAMPDDCGAGSGQPECIAAGGPLRNTDLSYYFDPDATTDTTISIKTRAQTDGLPGLPDDIQKVAVYNYLRCDVDNPGNPTSTAAGFRNVVALYTIESGANGRENRCQEL